jgi:hypothetical protein
VVYTTGNLSASSSPSSRSTAKSTPKEARVLAVKKMSKQLFRVIYQLKHPAATVYINNVVCRTVTVVIEKKEIYDFWILKMQRKTTYVPMWSTGATPGSTCVNGRCNSRCRQIELLSNNSHFFLTCALGLVVVTLPLSHTEIYSFCKISHIYSRGMHQGRSQRIAPLPAWCNENKWVGQPSL